MTTIEGELLTRLRGILDEDSRYAVTSDDAISRIRELLDDYEAAVRRGGWGMIGGGA